MSSDSIDGADWSMPGVRLMDRVLEDAGFDVEIHTAVPVFIGWRYSNTSMLDAGRIRMQRISSKTEYDNATAKAGGSAQSVSQQSSANGVKPAISLDWLDSVMGASLKLYFDNGGGPCYVLEIDEPTQADHLWLDADSAQTPFMPLLQEPAITLAAMPQLAAWLSNKMKQREHAQEKVNTRASYYVAAWKNWLGACRERRDVFYVLDAPSDVWTASECIKLLRDEPISLDQGQHAALYGPHLQTDYDLSENHHDFLERIPQPVVPPCGAVLGLIVRTDAAHGVWRAPANEALSHVVAPVYQKTPPVYRETPLNDWFDVSGASINPIRSFPGRGVRVWGCSTLSSQAGSPFHYVQVRRMVTWVEANLRQICRFAVFEPNAELTWFQLRGLCSAWLRRVWLSGGLAGSDESEAFSVLVGLNESMTQADILQGGLIVKVGVAVLRAAEFLEIELVLSLNASESGATRALGSVTS